MTPPAEISLREVYDLLVAVRDDVTALKASGTAKAVADHEDRIRSLERKVWIAAGAAAVIGGLFGNIAPALIK